MKTEIDVWNALQRGESLRIEDVAKAVFNVDISGYVKTVSSDDLNRFRDIVRGCDGTAALTLQTLYEMIEPIINGKVYDKEKGEPNGRETGILYQCSPITYNFKIKRGKLKSGHEGDIQIDSFHINYTSEFKYD